MFGNGWSLFLYGVGASSLVVEDILQKWSRVGKPIILKKISMSCSHNLSAMRRRKYFGLFRTQGEAQM